MNSGKKYKLSGVRLLGRQSIENLLPAIFIGLSMGIDFSKIRKTLLSVRPFPGTMDPLKIKGGPTLIDDTYYANINSVTRALSYLKLYRGRRIMVLEPLTELGKHGKLEHIKLGEQVGRVCDILYLTNKNYYSEIVAGIKKSKGKCVVTIEPTSKIINFIKDECNNDDVVLFEGGEAAIPLSFIKKSAKIKPH